MPIRSASFLDRRRWPLSSLLLSASPAILARALSLDLQNKTAGRLEKSEESQLASGNHRKNYTARQQENREVTENYTADGK